jgi:eukaryotic-like serine/threonine-protein kinase
MSTAPLPDDTTVGRFRISSRIGRGGMGEVYKAYDSTLDRYVALKILPPELVERPDRIQRFIQEAKSASALNHPNIITVYEIGHDDIDGRSIHYIAMELLEGTTLREEIHVKRAPLKRLIDLLAQVADGLAKAHAAGIIHRDLKPDNIMVTGDGYAKVLDFGLAKLVEPRVWVSRDGPGLPTTPRTSEGALLGTIGYMAPEQAAGKPADQRSDVFSFGCVLYEAVTRARPFEADSEVDALHKILHDQPRPVEELSPEAPSELRRIIRRCLAKDPDERYQSMKDVAIELREISQEFQALSARPRARSVASIAPRRIRLAIPLIVIAVALTAAAILLLRKHPPPPVIQSALNLPAGSVFGAAALSPDGTRLVFAARPPESDTYVLWIRRLDTGTMEPLEGTNDGVGPFWSPDSQFIGFFANGKLKRIAASGGAAETICDAPTPFGGTWSRDGIILFAPSINDAIFRVSALGGNPVRVTRIDRNAGERMHDYPSLLPDGRHFLYSSRVFGSRRREDFIYAGSLDGKEKILLLRSSSSAVYAEPGYLLFMRGHTLFAQRFDANRLRLVGEARIAIDHVQRSSGLWIPATGSFAVSENGLLVYQAARGPQSKLVLLDRGGKEIEQVAPPADYLDPALSHDGWQAAVSVIDEEGNASIWRLDLPRHAMTRLTSDSMSELNPHFSPDDRRIVFASQRTVPLSIYVKDVTGSGPEVLLQASVGAPNDWSPDGRFILYSTFTQSEQFNLSVSSLADRKSIPIAVKAQRGKFSPDGRWIAYVSDESGKQEEVYVQSFPPGTGKWQVSTNGGDLPEWSARGKEIIYYAPDHKLIAVDVRTKPDGAFDAGVSRPLFDVHMAHWECKRCLRTAIGSGYSITPDGQRFLVNMAIDNPEPPITLVQNWPALLKR